MPSRESQQKALFRELFRGKTPDPRDLRTMGVDLVFLEEKFAKFKPFLEYMSGQKNLENLWTHAYDMDHWSEVVARNGLTGLKCLRMFRELDRGYTRSLLTLHPLSHGSTPRLEVFLTRKGKWLVYVGDGGTNENLTFHDTVNGLGRRLQTIARENNAYFHTEYGRGIPLLALALHLDEMVKRTLSERMKTTKSLEGLLAAMEEQTAVIRF